MWTCASCGESCEEQFDLCWKCEEPRARVIALGAEEEPALIPPPLPELPPVPPCARCNSERVLPVVKLSGLAAPQRLCTECGWLDLSPEQLLELWEDWIVAHTPAPAPTTPYPVTIAEEWREQVKPARGARVMVEAVAGSSFDAWLPLKGTVGADYDDAGGGPGWLCIELDAPFAATLRTGVSQRYLRLEVGALLVQADLGAGRDPRAWKRAGATFIPLEKERRPPGPAIALQEFPHPFRAACSAERE